MACIVYEAGGLKWREISQGRHFSKQRAEAERVVKICGLPSKLKVYTGANGKFESTRNKKVDARFDEWEAADLMTERAHAADT